MQKLHIEGKPIRLFFRSNLDGAVAASLVRIFSNAEILTFIPCQHHERDRGEIKDNVIDVFLGCRSTDRSEDVRLDNIKQDEPKDYLDRDGIVVESHFKSLVSLACHFLRININEQVIDEMEKMAHGKENVFSKFQMDAETLHKILLNPGLQAIDFDDYSLFKDKLLEFMVAGFAIEEMDDTPEGYEQGLEKRYKIVVEEIKKENAPLIKLIHTPTHEGFFEHVFKMEDEDFFQHVLPYIEQHYEVESKVSQLGAYAVIGFHAHNHEFDEKLIREIHDDHPEPFQIFVKRSTHNTSINIGKLIEEVKQETGILNGAGHDFIGELNTDDKDKAIAALRTIVSYIEKNAP